jgi:hypothetical protein
MTSSIVYWPSKQGLIQLNVGKVYVEGFERGRRVSESAGA